MARTSRENRQHYPQTQSQRRDRNNKLPRKLKSAVLSILGLISGFVFLAASPAYSVYFTYANDVSTPRVVERVSPAVYDIKGGRISTSSGGVGNLYIRTFLSHPGYQVLASGSGSAPGWVYLNHGTFSVAYSGCYWNAAYDIGPLNLTCEYDK